VNAARIAASLPPLGWINPAMYQLGSSFVKDITAGNNKCCAQTVANQKPVCCTQGFQAGTGWDPVTGLGSVNFANFKAALLGIGQNPTAAPSPYPTVAPNWDPTANLFPASTVIITDTSSYGYEILYSDLACTVPMYGEAFLLNTCAPATSGTGYTKRFAAFGVGPNTGLLYIQIMQYSDSLCTNPLTVASVKNAAVVDGNTCNSMPGYGSVLFSTTASLSSIIPTNAMTVR
jgi:hypothetical protein